MALALLIAATILFVIVAISDRSILAAGLACLAASMLV